MLTLQICNLATVLRKKMLSQSQELFYQVGGLGLSSGCHFRLVQIILEEINMMCYLLVYNFCKKHDFITKF